MCARFKGAQMEKLSTDRDTETSSFKVFKESALQKISLFCEKLSKRRAGTVPPR